MTIEDPETNKIGSTPDNSGRGSLAKSQAEVHPPIKGVSILGFSPQSSAEKAGMQKGDVIIEYDGVGNLTTDQLAALTATTTFKGTQLRVVFVRGGREHSLSVAPGSLGISAMDSTIQGSFGKPQKQSRDKPQRHYSLDCKGRLDRNRAFRPFSALLGAVSDNDTRSGNALCFDGIGVEEDRLGSPRVSQIQQECC